MKNAIRNRMYDPPVSPMERPEALSDWEFGQLLIAHRTYQFFRPKDRHVWFAGSDIPCVYMRFAQLRYLNAPYSEHQLSNLSAHWTRYFTKDLVHKLNYRLQVGHHDDVRGCDEDTLYGLMHRSQVAARTVSRAKQKTVDGLEFPLVKL